MMSIFFKAKKKSENFENHLIDYLNSKNIYSNPIELLLPETVELLNIEGDWKGILSNKSRKERVYRTIQLWEEYITEFSIIIDVFKKKLISIDSILYQKEIHVVYTLKDYDGVSAKSGNPANTSIVYSTQHIEKSANESLYKLDFETRGVLYHELVHAYQFEPKGIGSYSTNKTFWACIEGLADAVRAQAGYFDMSTRKPGGNWMDGYRTTGFFIQWLTTKDPDAIRKFHETVRDLDEWSFDKAIKRMFGEDASIEGLWNEYQAFLSK